MVKIASSGHSDVVRSAIAVLATVVCLLSMCDVGRAKVTLYKCCKQPTDVVVNGSCTAADQHADEEPFRVPTADDGKSVTYYEPDTFAIVIGSPCLNGFYLMEPDTYPEEAYRIDAITGRLNTAKAGVLEPNEYCVARHDTKAVSAFRCFPNNTQHTEADTDKMQMAIYSTAMFLSVPFLVITFLVYACLRELRNLHGKSLMCHVFSLAVAYFCLAFNQVVNPTGVICTVSAYIVQISFLASFLWLNVMCFDLWWTFSGFRPLRGNAKRQEAKKFVVYSVYAWGCSIIMLIITLSVELLSNYVIRPGLGEICCWFSSKKAAFLYFYGPVGLLLFSNLLMFIYTTVKIVKHMRNAKVLVGSESKKNIDHEKQRWLYVSESTANRFMLYLKLFIVMGINWLAEVISWAVESSSRWWYVTDIGNTLQGVLIFLIFVCKKRVLKLLKKKLCPNSAQSMSGTLTRTSTFSRSSCRTKGSIEMNNVSKQISTSDSVSDFKA